MYFSGILQDGLGSDNCDIPSSEPVTMRSQVFTEVNICIMVLTGYGILKCIWLNRVLEEIKSRKNAGNK